MKTKVWFDLKKTVIELSKAEQTLYTKKGQLSVKNLFLTYLLVIRVKTTYYGMQHFHQKIGYKHFYDFFRQK